MSTRPDFARQAFATEPRAEADATALDAFLADVRRRVRARDVARAALLSGGLLIAGVVVASLFRVTGVAGFVAAIGIAGIGLAAWLSARTARWHEAALLPLVESRQPAFRNLLVTARELTTHPHRAKPIIRQRVLRDAAAIAHDTSIDVIVSPRDTRRAMTAASVMLIAALLLSYGIARWQYARDRAAGVGTTTAASSPSAAANGTPTAGIRGVTAVIAPPAYTGRPAITLKDPTQFTAIAGSRLLIDIDIASASREPLVRFNDRAQTVTAGAQTFRSELTLAETGVLMVNAARADLSADAASPRLMAITVVPDEPPTVEIVAPGKDLLFGDAGARVDFSARAQDDLGLRTLALRFTRVSGSGEQYEFDEGELPLVLERRDGRQWHGRLTRSLRDLGLSAGDLFVYYAAATDGRPDAAAGRAVSDSYVIEVGKPGVAVAGGFAIPPDEDRFAISLNALIQKTEKLHARRATTPPAEFHDAALALAVEQRMVRTEFIFTMGFHGHVEDEEVEAEHSNEIQEGRMENRGQAEMLTATRLMTLAEHKLTASDTAEALKAQRGALAAVQRALSRHRYFLRTLPTAAEIDLARRLTGDLSAATSARWPATDRPHDERQARARAVLSDLARLTRALDADANHAARGARTPDAAPVATRPSDSGDAGANPVGGTTRATSAGRAGDDRASQAALANAAATRVLSLDPSSAALQSASMGLTQAAGHIASGRAREALALVRKAADAVLPLAQPTTSASTSEPSSAPTEPGLRGAVVDALRHRGGSR